MRKYRNRYFYHIFVSPGDAPGAITLNIVGMERVLNAYKLSHSMYLSIFNSLLVIRTASAKNRHFYVQQPTFLFPLGTPCDYHRVCCIDGKTIQCLSFVSEICLQLLLQLIDAWKLTLKQLVTYANILMN